MGRGKKGVFSIDLGLSDDDDDGAASKLNDSRTSRGRQSNDGSFLSPKGTKGGSGTKQSKDESIEDLLSSKDSALIFGCGGPPRKKSTYGGINLFGASSRGSGGDPLDLLAQEVTQRNTQVAPSNDDTREAEDEEELQFQLELQRELALVGIGNDSTTSAAEMQQERTPQQSPAPNDDTSDGDLDSIMGDILDDDDGRSKAKSSRSKPPLPGPLPVSPTKVVNSEPPRTLQRQASNASFMSSVPESINPVESERGSEAPSRAGSRNGSRAGSFQAASDLGGSRTGSRAGSIAASDRAASDRTQASPRASDPSSGRESALENPTRRLDVTAAKALLSGGGSDSPADSDWDSESNKSEKGDEATREPDVKESSFAGDITASRDTQMTQMYSDPVDVELKVEAKPKRRLGAAKAKAAPKQDSEKQVPTNDSAEIGPSRTSKAATPPPAALEEDQHVVGIGGQSSCAKEKRDGEESDWDDSASFNNKSMEEGKTEEVSDHTLKKELSLARSPSQASDMGSSRSRSKRTSIGTPDNSTPVADDACEPDASRSKPNDVSEALSDDRRHDREEENSDWDDSGDADEKSAATHPDSEEREIEDTNEPLNTDTGERGTAVMNDTEDSKEVIDVELQVEAKPKRRLGKATPKATPVAKPQHVVDSVEEPQLLHAQTKNQDPGDTSHLQPDRESVDSDWDESDDSGKRVPHQKDGATSKFGEPAAGGVSENAQNLSGMKEGESMLSGIALDVDLKVDAKPKRRLGKAKAQPKASDSKERESETMHEANVSLEAETIAKQNLKPSSSPSPTPSRSGSVFHQQEDREYGMGDSDGESESPSEEKKSDPDENALASKEHSVTSQGEGQPMSLASEQHIITESRDDMDSAFSIELQSAAKPKRRLGKPKAEPIPSQSGVVPSGDRAEIGGKANSEASVSNSFAGRSKMRLETSHVDDTRSSAHPENADAEDDDWDEEEPDGLQIQSEAKSTEKVAIGSADINADKNTSTFEDDWDKDGDPDGLQIQSKAKSTERVLIDSGDIDADKETSTLHLSSDKNMQSTEDREDNDATRSDFDRVSETKNNTKILPEYQKTNVAPESSKHQVPVTQANYDSIAKSSQVDPKDDKKLKKARARPEPCADSVAVAQSQLIDPLASRDQSEQTRENISKKTKSEVVQQKPSSPPKSKANGNASSPKRSAMPGSPVAESNIADNLKKQSKEPKEKLRVPQTMDSTKEQEMVTCEHASEISFQGSPKLSVPPFSPRQRKEALQAEIAEAEAQARLAELRLMEKSLEIEALELRLPKCEGRPGRARQIPSSTLEDSVAASPRSPQSPRTPRVGVEDTPAAPEAPVIEVVDEKCVRISWIAVHHTPEVTGYAVAVHDGTLKYYDADSGTLTATQANAFPIASSTTFVLVKGLVCGSRCKAEVACLNKAGWSQYSAPSKSITLSPPSVPKPPTLQVIGSDSLRVSWSLVQHTTRPPVTGYSVTICSADALYYVDAYTGTLSSDSAGLTPASAETDSLVVRGVCPQIYHSAAVAAHNKWGWGGYSQFCDEVAIETPPIPLQPTIKAVGPESIRVSWAKTTHTPEITGYGMLVIANDRTFSYFDSKSGFLVASAADANHVHASATSISVHGLRIGVQYKVRIAAQNNIGWGRYSVPSDTIVLSVPAAPQNVTIEIFNAESICVRWVAGTTQLPLTNFAVTVYSDGFVGYYDARTQKLVDNRKSARSVHATSDSAIVKGLRPGVIYKARVASRNDVGWGKYSGSSRQAMIETPPQMGPPTIGIVDSSCLRVSWTLAPAAFGTIGYGIVVSDGAMLKYYDASSKKLVENRKDCTSVRPDKTSIVIKGLHAKIPYKVKVSAKNGVDWGKYSPWCEAIKIESPPPPLPPITRVLEYGSVRVTWQPVEHIPTVTGYLIAVFDGTIKYFDALQENLCLQAKEAHAVPAAAVSVAVKGLTNGAECKFRVAAINDVGVGPFSSSSDAVTVEETDDMRLWPVLPIDLAPRAPLPRTMQSSQFYTKVFGAKQDLAETRIDTCFAAVGEDAAAYNSLRQSGRSRAEAAVETWLDLKAKSSAFFIHVNKVLLRDDEEQLEEFAPVLEHLCECIAKHNPKRTRIMWRGSKLTRAQVRSLGTGEMIRPPMFVSSVASEHLAECYRDVYMVRFIVHAKTRCAGIIGERQGSEEMVLLPYTLLRVLAIRDDNVVEVEVLDDAEESTPSRAFPI